MFDQRVVRKTFSQRFYEFWRRGDSSGMASKRGVLKMINIQSLAMPSLSPAFSPAYVSFFGGFDNNYVGVQIGRQEYVYVGDYLLLLIWQQVSFLLDLKILFVFSWLLIC